MLKSSPLWLLVPLALGAGAIPAAAGAVLGPGAVACARGGPAMLVRVTGFKARTGVLTVKAYADPATYFDKGAYLDRVEVKVPASGAADICLPVPRPGEYAVSVKHDVDGSGKTGRSDGGGMSGNPRLSLADLIFKRKPDPAQVTVPVRGVTTVPVVLNYLQGGAFRPLATAGR